MIIFLLMNYVPDTWEPSTIWYMAAFELLIEVFLLSLIPFVIW